MPVPVRASSSGSGARYLTLRSDAVPVRSQVTWPGRPAVFRHRPRYSSSRDQLWATLQTIVDLIKSSFVKVGNPPSEKVFSMLS